MCIRNTQAGIIFIVLSAVGLLILYLMPAVDAFVDMGRCGVDLAPCEDGKRCINGYCKSDNPPTMPAISDLPVLPPLVGSGQTRL